jgi:hypothetical protein
MTRTDIMADWDRCEILAARMIAVGIDRRKVDDWLAVVAEFLRLRLEQLEAS